MSFGCISQSVSNGFEEIQTNLASPAGQSGQFEGRGGDRRKCVALCAARSVITSVLRVL